MNNINTLINANAIDMLRQMPKCFIDAIITDPPYSSGGQYRGDRVGDTRDKYLTSGEIAAAMEGISTLE